MRANPATWFRTIRQPLCTAGAGDVLAAGDEMATGWPYGIILEELTRLEGQPDGTYVALEANRGERRMVGASITPSGAGTLEIAEQQRVTGTLPAPSDTTATMPMLRLDGWPQLIAETPGGRGRRRIFTGRGATPSERSRWPTRAAPRATTAGDQLTSDITGMLAAAREWPRDDTTVIEWSRHADPRRFRRVRQRAPHAAPSRTAHEPDGDPDYRGEWNQRLTADAEAGPMLINPIPGRVLAMLVGDRYELTLDRAGGADRDRHSAEAELHGLMARLGEVLYEDPTTTPATTPKATIDRWHRLRECAHANGRTRPPPQPPKEA